MIETKSGATIDGELHKSDRNRIAAARLLRLTYAQNPAKAHKQQADALVRGPQDVGKFS